MSPLSLRHGFRAFDFLTLQVARAFAFISGSISAYTLVVVSETWPSQALIVWMSTPARRKCVAVVCRITWGLTRFLRSEGACAVARAVRERQAGSYFSGRFSYLWKGLSLPERATGRHPGGPPMQTFPGCQRANCQAAFVIALIWTSSFSALPLAAGRRVPCRLGLPERKPGRCWGLGQLPLPYSSEIASQSGGFLTSAIIAWFPAAINVIPVG